MMLDLERIMSDGDKARLGMNDQIKESVKREKQQRCLNERSEEGPDRG